MTVTTIVVMIVTMIHPMMGARVTSKKWTRPTENLAVVSTADFIQGATVGCSSLVAGGTDAWKKLKRASLLTTFRVGRSRTMV
jgi:hypothetical protein